MSGLFDDTAAVARAAEHLADLGRRTTNPVLATAIATVLEGYGQAVAERDGLKDLARRTLDAQQAYFRDKVGLDQCKDLERQLRAKVKE